MSLAIPPSLRQVGAATYGAALSAAVALSDTPDSGVVLPGYPSGNVAGAQGAPANYALLRATTQDVHLEWDGTDATTDSFLLPKDVVLELNNARTLLVNMSMLEAADSAVVYITYFYGD